MSTIDWRFGTDIKGYSWFGPDPTRLRCNYWNDTHCLISDCPDTQLVVWYVIVSNDQSRRKSFLGFCDKHRDAKPLDVDIGEGWHYEPVSEAEAAVFNVMTS